MWGTLKLPQSLWLWSPLPLSWSGWARFLRPAGSDDGARAPTEGEQHTKNAHTTSNRTPQPLSPEADPFVQGGTLGEEQNVLREWSGVIQKAGRGEAEGRLSLLKAESKWFSCWLIRGRFSVGGSNPSTSATPLLHSSWVRLKPQFIGLQKRGDVKEDEKPDSSF